MSDDIVQPARSRSRRERSLVPLIMNPRPITLDARFSVRKSVGTAEIELHEADNWVIFKEKVRVAMLTVERNDEFIYDHDCLVKIKQSGRTKFEDCWILTSETF